MLRWFDSLIAEHWHSAVLIAGAVIAAVYVYRNREQLFFKE